MGLYQRGDGSGTTYMELTDTYTKQTLLSLVLFSCLLIVGVPLLATQPIDGPAASHAVVTAQSDGVDDAYNELLISGYHNDDFRPVINTYASGIQTYGSGRDTIRMVGRTHDADNDWYEGNIPRLQPEHTDWSERYIATRDGNTVYVIDRYDKEVVGTVSGHVFVFAMGHLVTAVDNGDGIAVEWYTVTNLDNPIRQENYDNTGLDPRDDDNAVSKGVILNGGNVVFMDGDYILGIGPHGNIKFDKPVNADLIERSRAGDTFWIADRGNIGIAEYTTDGGKKTGRGTIDTVRGFEPHPDGGMVYTTEQNGDIHVVYEPTQGTQKWKTETHSDIPTGGSGIPSTKEYAVPITVTPSGDVAITEVSNYEFDHSDGYSTMASRPALYDGDTGQYIGSTGPYTAGSPEDILSARRDLRESKAIQKFLAPLHRLETLARYSAITAGAIGLVVGAIGFVIQRRTPHRVQRAKEYMRNGGAALVAIYSLDAIYGAISWVMTGSSQAVPYVHGVPRWTNNIGFQFVDLFGFVSLGAGVMGYIMALGACLLFSLGTRGSKRWFAGKKATMYALGMFGISVGGRIFSGVLFVLGSGV